MDNLRLLSWNVNGIRAICNKGFAAWLAKESPDIMCIQESKAQESQIPDELLELAGYYCYFSGAERKGYSGVGLWTKSQPITVRPGFGIELFDCEGRVLIADYDDFLLYNVYFPNGGASQERLDYKMAFYDAFLEQLKKAKRKQKNIIICGDVNTAHKEIDLSRPRQNETNSGFLPEERAWLDRLLKAGFHDTLRLFDDSPERYTWWDYKTRARERNVGWRIDYFFVSDAFKDNITSAFIMNKVMGSDHCPIGITI